MVERPTVATMKPLVAERPSGIVHQLKLLIRNRVFVWTVLGLSALFFVVTGIQFWVTPYLVLGMFRLFFSHALKGSSPCSNDGCGGCIGWLSDLGENVGYVGLAFIFASATGPTVGVLFGGYVVDRAGGYQGRTQALTYVPHLPSPPPSSSFLPPHWHPPITLILFFNHFSVD
jgi:hypothetical protein